MSISAGRVITLQEKIVKAIVRAEKILNTNLVEDIFRDLLKDPTIKQQVHDSINKH